MAYYPLPIVESVKSPAPAAIVVPRSGDLTIQHYYGNTERPDADRLWIVEPTRHAGEVTTGDRAENYPGDTRVIDVVAGETVRLGINGVTNAPQNVYPSHTRYNDGDNARLAAIHPSVGSWGWYIEWEDLDLISDGSGGYTNSHYNDSRTLVFFPPGGWLVGHVGIAPGGGIG